MVCGRTFKHKGRCEVLKHCPGVSCAVHLTPPLPVLVFPLQFGHQSDVATSGNNHLVPAEETIRESLLSLILIFDIFVCVLSC